MAKQPQEVRVSFKQLEKMKVGDVRKLYKTLGVNSKEAYEKQLKKLKGGKNE